ncbi:MAG: glycosyltransferase family 4 protein, partial [Parabacteroides sp.]
MKHIVCFHLFNDYSGSPKVLKMVLEGLLEKGYRVDLVTSKGGVLDELMGRNNLSIHTYPYHFSTNPVVTMCRYAAIQLYTFFVALRWLFDKDTVFYINTLLPVGPALAGRMTGKRVVYHYHENAFIKSAFYKVLAWMMQRLAHEIICVSDYQASFLPRKDKVCVIGNALTQNFVAKLHPHAEAAFKRQTILMLSSLKGYKGTIAFIELSKRLPQYSFIIVINDIQENIETYLKEHSVQVAPESNLAIFPRQNDVSGFYMQSSVVLNLSDKNRFIETFGLTALEAMRAGLPVIVPTVGGIAEMVEDGVNGYKIDVQHLDRIERRIKEMLSHQELYIKMADNALQHAHRYDAEE